jgi:hypothetical protein
MPFSTVTHLKRWRRTALGLLVATAMASSTWAATDNEDAMGALIAELAFHADLMTALDRQCPRAGAATDWHAALAPPVRRWLTADLGDISRRLSADASARLIQEHGGCATRDFAHAYAEQREQFLGLVDRWAQLGA